MSNIRNFSASYPAFCQLLSFIPRDIIKTCVAEHDSDKYFKTLKIWDQFVTMCYAVLVGNPSLRAIELNFSLLGKKIKELGLKQVPQRSSISYVNEHRESSVFRAIYFALYNYYHDELKKAYLSELIGQQVAPTKVEIFDIKIDGRLNRYSNKSSKISN